MEKRLSVRGRSLDDIDPEARAAGNARRLARQNFLALVNARMKGKPYALQPQIVAEVRATTLGARYWNEWKGDDADETEATKRQMLSELVIEFGSLVDRGANQHAHIMLTKGDTSMHTTTTTAPDTRRFSDVVWAAVQDLGAIIKQRNPALTTAEANTEALKTDEGGRLYKLYNDPNAHLSVSEYLAHQRMLAKRRAAGFETWDQAVDNCAQLIAKRDDIAYPAALDKVATEYPLIWDCYVSGGAA